MNLRKGWRQFSSKRRNFMRLLRVRIVGPRIIDAGIFKGKSIIIIGPAQTVDRDLKEIDLDRYDLIIRMNNSARFANENAHLLGERTDILFHNLVDSGERSAGTIDERLILDQKISIIVYPHASLKQLNRRVFGQISSLPLPSNTEVKLPPFKFYQSIVSALGGFRPTTGTVAILYVLQCEFSELTLCGFSFFETQYLAGYNDAVQSDEDAVQWAVASGLHDPSREKVLIRARIDLARSNGKTITIGSATNKHLEN